MMQQLLVTHDAAPDSSPAVGCIRGVFFKRFMNGALPVER